MLRELLASVSEKALIGSLIAVIRENGEAVIFEVPGCVLEAHAGSLLWLIKAELCFLSRAQSVKGFKRKKLSFHFIQG